MSSLTFAKKSLFYNQKPESYVFLVPHIIILVFIVHTSMGFTFFILFCFLRVFDLSNPSNVVRSEKRDNKWSFISMTSASERLRSSEESHLDSSKLNYAMEWNYFWRRNLFFLPLRFHSVIKFHVCGIEYGFMKISLKRWTMNLKKCSLRKYCANRFAFCCMYRICTM